MNGIEGATWYRLADRGDPAGMSCDERGFSLGQVPLLCQLRRDDDHPLWAPRDTSDLNIALGSAYGFPSI